MPSKSSAPCEDSFGIFISYKTDAVAPDGLSNNDYTKACEAKMNDEIINSINYIIQQIKDNSLENHSFYLFFLPLFDIEEKVPEIVSGAFGGVSLFISGSNSSNPHSCIITDPFP